MKRVMATVFAATLLAAGVLGQTAHGGESEKLTNEDVLKMTKAGLPASVIVAKINTSQTMFATSVDELVSLSNAGVDASVIEAMTTAGSTPTAPAPAAATSAAAVVAVGATAAPTSRSNFAGTPCAEPGIFVEQGENLLGIDITSVSQSRTGSGVLSGPTYGIVSTKAKAVVRGIEAMLRVQQPKPTFWFCFEEASADLSYQTTGAVNPSEFMLVSFKVKKRKREREFEVGKFNMWSGSQSGTPPKQLKDVNYTKVQPGVYRVQPIDALEPGEYGFYYGGQSALSAFGMMGGTGGKIFAFGLDA